MRFELSLAALMLVGASAALGQPSADETLTATLSRQTLGPASGSSAGAEWMAPIGSASYSFGLEGLRVADSEWWLLKAGTVRRLGGSWTLSADLQAGPARLEGERIVMRKVRMGADRRLSAQWALHVQSSYYDVAPISGQLVTVGASWLGSKLSLRTQLTDDIGGSIDDGIVLIRADLPLPKLRLFFGAAHGESNNRDLLARLPTADLAQRTQTMFFGSTIPMGRMSVTVVLDRVRSGGTLRRGLTLSLGKRVGWLGR